jgi:K+ transporter
LKLSLAALGVVFGDIGMPPDQIVEVGVQMQL